MIIKPAEIHNDADLVYCNAIKKSRESMIFIKTVANSDTVRPYFSRHIEQNADIERTLRLTISQ
jgi:hypothetical protein